MSAEFNHGAPLWAPSASVERLQARARCIDGIRGFFRQRGVLEVETPLLASSTASDPYLDSLSTRLTTLGGHERVFLQTSPELPMKRLLAGGSGAIYQICKAFRDGESGRLHNPEFTILEWYRPGWDHHQLMDEIDALLAEILATAQGERVSYAALFQRHLGVDVFEVSESELASIAGARIPGAPRLEDEDRDGYLDLLLTHLIEDQLGRGRPTFVYDYPASQAALARISEHDARVAERFEVWVEGIELANGYYELCDPREQRRRIEADNRRRRELGRPEVPVDKRFIAALEAGMPQSSGVALGLDRLIMLALGASSIQEVVAFPADRV